MNGKLAKQIRRAVNFNFNPNEAREYRRTNVSQGFLYHTYTAVATGHRAVYQAFKASVLGRKRGRR